MDVGKSLHEQISTTLKSILNTAISKIKDHAFNQC